MDLGLAFGLKGEKRTCWWKNVFQIKLFWKLLLKTFENFYWKLSWKSFSASFHQTLFLKLPLKASAQSIIFQLNFLSFRKLFWFKNLKKLLSKKAFKNFPLKSFKKFSKISLQSKVSKVVFLKKAFKSFQKLLSFSPTLNNFSNNHQKTNIDLTSFLIGKV